MALCCDERTRRVSAYVALAGGIIPAAVASGAIVSQTGLDLMVTDGSPQAIDFGPGFGEIFQFSVNTATGIHSSNRSSMYGGWFFSFRTYTFQSHVVQFDPANGGGWTSAQMVNYGFGNDPVRLSAGVPLTGGSQWYGPMSSGLGRANDLAFASRMFTDSAFVYYSMSGATTYSGGTFRSDSTAYYDWAPDERGYLGLRFTQNGMDYHYAWFDVEVDRNNFKMIIHGWGFEDEINTPLETGQEVPGPTPIGLSLLAMGAAGIRRHRREVA